MDKRSIFVVFFILLCIYSQNKYTIVESAFEESNNLYDENISQDYYLLFDNFSLSTSNFVNIFSFFKNNQYEYNILEIVPCIVNSNIKNKFIYHSNDLDFIVNKFSNEYLDAYKNNGESVIYQINIQIVKINTSSKGLYEFLKMYSKVKYRAYNEFKYKGI